MASARASPKADEWCQSDFRRSKRATRGVESARGAHYVCPMRIAIASDHAATDLKAELAEWLMEQGHEAQQAEPQPGREMIPVHEGPVNGGSVAKVPIEKKPILAGPVHRKTVHRTDQAGHHERLTCGIK